MIQRNTIPPVKVTDNALLRWLEKVERFDVEALREQLARSAGIGIEVGASAVIVGSGKLLIEGGAVTSVVRRCDHPVRLIGKIEAEIGDEVVLYRRPKRRRG